MSHKSDVILFEDKDVKLSEQYIEIKCYYFPIATSKKIPISKIEKLQYGQLSLMSGSGRLWGMSIGKMGYWFAGDLSRMSRTHYLAIHTGSSIKPTFTSQKLDVVYRLLKELVDKYKNNQLHQRQGTSQQMNQSNKKK